MPDDAVIDQLRAYAEAAEAAVPEVAPLASRRNRRGRVVLAVAAAVAIVAGVAGAIALQDDDDELPVTSGPDEPSAAVSAGGRWDELPAAPVAGRVGHVTVATDDELIVWGGRNDNPLADGAAWSFDEQRWRTLAPSPLSARSNALAVWTGEEVLITGGGERDGRSRQTAAYDPDTDSWRSLPSPTFDAFAELSDAVWTGSEMVVVGTSGLANEFHSSSVYALDPSSGDWRAVEPPPVRQQSGPVRAMRAQWAGDQLLVVVIADGDPVSVDRLDVDENTWDPPVLTRVNGLDLDPQAVVWTGDELVLAGSYEDGAIFDPASGEVRPLPASRSRARYPARVVEGVVTVGDRLLPADGRWVEAAPIPVPREFPGAAVHDGRYYVWGGSGCGEGASCSQFVPADKGLVWTPSGPETSSTTSSSAPSQPSIPGEAAFDLSAEVTCGPTDATEVMVELRARRRRTVTVVVVPFEGETATVLAGPKSIELPAETDVAEFVSFNVRVDELQASGRPIEVRVEDKATGELQALHVIPMQTPSCG